MSDELDIIDRLRNEVDMCNNDGVYDIAILCNDAIEEIDRLSKTVKTLTNEANDPPTWMMKPLRDFMRKVTRLSPTASWPL